MCTRYNRTSKACWSGQPECTPMGATQQQQHQSQHTQSTTTITNENNNNPLTTTASVFSDMTLLSQPRIALKQEEERTQNVSTKIRRMQKGSVTTQTPNNGM